MGLNLTANWHLIRCFDTLLKASGAGRAIFVTSGVTTHPSPYWGSYTVSKTALEAMVQLYAAENRKSYPNLCINLLDPGRVRTRMRAQAFPGEDAMTLPDPDGITDRFVALAGPECTATGEKFFVR
jgi:NAD(P)-dependent dehydrogenase (short-subunit alcohol dehydrogenase family)